MFLCFEEVVFTTKYLYTRHTVQGSSGNMNTPQFIILSLDTRLGSTSFLRIFLNCHIAVLIELNQTWVLVFIPLLTNKHNLWQIN